MTVKDKAALQKKTLLVLLFALLISSCVTPNKNSNVTVMTTESIIAPPVVRETPTPTTTVIPCTPSQVNLNKLANVDQIDEYRWSDDGGFFYFRSGNDSWKYSVISKEMTYIPSSEVVATPTPSDVEQRFQTILNETPTIQSAYFSLSPSGRKLVYWSDPDSTSMEGYDAIAFQEQEIFLLQEGISKSVYIGKIKGAIQEGYWLPGEERIVLEMLDFSPYNYLWLVDIPSRSLIPLISIEDVSGARKFSVLDISPDGNWVMYQANTAKNVFIININTHEIKPIYAIPHTPNAFWLPDGKRILARVYDGLILYNMDKQSTTQIASDVQNDRSIALLRVFNGKLTLASIKSTVTTIDEYRLSIMHDIDILNLCLDY